MPVKKGARKHFSAGDIRNLHQFGGDLPTLKARKDLTDEFRKKMLCDNPVRFYRLSEGDIAAARKAKGN